MVTHSKEGWDSDVVYCGYSYLKRANLVLAHLEGALLSDAHLKRANLSGAHLEGANLSGAHLEGANLSSAYGLTPEQLASAYTDEATRLPNYPN
jgi:uncharacterized protein YjbI with pentapeptide repeats